MNFLNLEIRMRGKFEKLNISFCIECRCKDNLLSCIAVAVPFPTIIFVAAKRALMALIVRR